MITRPAVARLRKEGPEVLIRKMKERDITVLPVIDENEKLVISLKNGREVQERKTIYQLLPTF